MKGFALGLTLGLASCAVVLVNVDGFALDQENWEKSSQELRRKVAFDMGCTVRELQLTVLDEERKNATEVGVVGCEQRVRYMREIVDTNAMAAARRYGPWVANVAAN